MLMATFDGVRGRSGRISGRFPGRPPGRFGSYEVYEDPAVLHSAQQAETEGRLYWPTVRRGVFGGCGTCGLQGDEPSTRGLGLAIGGATVLLAIGIFVATVNLGGVR